MKKLLPFWISIVMWLVLVGCWWASDTDTTIIEDAVIQTWSVWTWDEDFGTQSADWLVDCLLENDYKLYSIDWCKYCQDQVEVFWERADEIVSIDCDADRNICLAANVSWFPTSEFKWILYPGLMTKEALMALCK